MRKEVFMLVFLFSWKWFAGPNGASKGEQPLGGRAQNIDLRGDFT